MALLQLATTENIFLLDMLALTECMTEADWEAFAGRLFANPNLVKLGKLHLGNGPSGVVK